MTETPEKKIPHWWDERSYCKRCRKFSEQLTDMQNCSKKPDLLELQTRLKESTTEFNKIMKEAREKTNSQMDELVELTMVADLSPADLGTFFHFVMEEAKKANIMANKFKTRRL